MKALFLRATDWLANPRRLILLLVLAFVVILTGSVLPSLSARSTSFGSAVIKNSSHVPMYLVLTFFLFVLLKQSHLFFHARRRALYSAALLAFLVGVAMEFMQSLIPSRTADLFDVILNLWGIMLMVVAIEYYWYRLDIVRRLSFQPVEHEYHLMARSREMMMVRERLLQFISPERAFFLYVVSTFPGEGKTTITQGLRRSLTQTKPIYFFEQGSGRLWNETGAVIAQINEEDEFMQWVARIRSENAILLVDGDAVLDENHLISSAVIAGAADYLLWVIGAGRVTAPQFSQASTLLALPENKAQGVVFNSILS